VSVLIPGEIRLAGAIDVELHLPAKYDFRARGIGAHSEPDWNAGFRPALEGVADRIEERRLKVGDRPGREVHPYRAGGAILPAV